MAKRRMLSIDFCESDSFYMLSPTARMLYVHFILNADDDGFVDKWRTVLRCSRIERRHYETLKRGGYIIELNEGLIVITDWHRHNTIRSDRYVATAYAKELQGLSLDENKRYIKGKSDALVATCVPQIREDKSREDNIREENNRVEEEKNSAFTTNHKSIHSRVASLPGSEQNNYSSLSLQSIKLLIKIYFMKNYSIDEMDGFVNNMEATGWGGIYGPISKENYREYIEDYMK